MTGEPCCTIACHGSFVLAEWPTVRRRRPCPRAPDAVARTVGRLLDEDVVEGVLVAPCRVAVLTLLGDVFHRDRVTHPSIPVAANCSLTLTLLLRDGVSRRDDARAVRDLVADRELRSTAGPFSVIFFEPLVTSSREGRRPCGGCAVPASPLRPGHP